MNVGLLQNSEILIKYVIFSFGGFGKEKRQKHGLHMLQIFGRLKPILMDAMTVGHPHNYKSISGQALVLPPNYGRGNMSKKKLIVITLAIVGIFVFSAIIMSKFIFRDDWDVWVDKQVDFSIKQKLAEAKQANIVILDKDIDKIREKMRTELKENAVGLKKILAEPPVINKAFKFKNKQNQPKRYEGPWPQTAQSVIEAFYEYENYRHGYDDELDAKYPLAEWITMILAKGATFEHYGDYSRYIDARRRFAGYENNPEAWQSGNFGVAPANDLETFKHNYIEREIWEVQQYKEAKNADPNVRGGTFMGPNDSVFIPFNGNNIYIDQIDGGFKSFGVSLTEREFHDLMFKGIPPEGLEVIYIDSENGTFLDEKPSSLNWKTIIEKAGPPPPGWEKNLPEGWSPPPGLIEAINNKFKNTDTATQTLDNGPTISPEQTLDNEPTVPPEAAVVQDAHPNDITQAEQDFLEMLTKSEAKWEAEFDVELKRFLTQEGLIVPSDADFEKEVRNKFAEEVITPIILEKAMETLERDGMTEGFRKLQKEDPEVAKVIAELIGARQQQRKSQRYTPQPKPHKPPTPPELEED